MNSSIIKMRLLTIFVIIFNFLGGGIIYGQDTLLFRLNPSLTTKQQQDTFYKNINLSGLQTNYFYDRGSSCKEVRSIELPTFTQLPFLYLTLGIFNFYLKTLTSK